jgi:hypothetical protein
MKRDRLITVLTIAALAGCAPVAVVERPAVLGTGSAIVLRVQALVREQCRFNPSADTVGAILATAYAPGDIADAICLAILQSRGDPSTPRVNGVAVIGRFVR